MSSIVTVRIPMAPDRLLFPNKQGKSLHWATRSKHRKISREAACKAASRLNLPTISLPVIITIHARYGSRRRLPDLDASISACKPMIDGLVEAGLLQDDRQMVKITATHEKVTKADDAALTGETIITIEEAP